MSLNTEEKKRLIYVILAMAAGLGLPAFAMRRDHAATIIVLPITIIFALCFMVPAYLIGLRQSRLRTIYQSVDLLRRNQPCDREALKHACESFPQDPNIKALGSIPLDAPVPIDLLHRIYMSPPPAQAVQYSRLLLLSKLLMPIMILAAIVKLIHAL